MKELRDYSYLLPSWMREDKNFITVYHSIINIFRDCQEVKEQIIKSFNLNKLWEYDSSLETIASYFGVNRNFYLYPGIKVTNIDFDNNSYDYSQNEEVINIQLENKILLKVVKFKLLQSNFNGTIKSLQENYEKLFGDKNIQFIETNSMELNIPSDTVYPVLRINMNIYEGLTLDEATLWLNGAFSFNYVGVNIRYSLGGRTLELIWDESHWDKSIWKEFKEE